MSDKKNIRWVARGDVRGECEHYHRTEEAAQRCCDRDHAGVRSAYPGHYPTESYSDRVPVRVRLRNV